MSLGHLWSIELSRVKQNPTIASRGDWGRSAAIHIRAALTPSIAPFGNLSFVALALLSLRTSATTQVDSPPDGTRLITVDNAFFHWMGLELFNSVEPECSTVIGCGS
jgi:hypothetical protein